jgi:hypothetical protein
MMTMTTRRMFALALIAIGAMAATGCHYHVSPAQVWACDAEVTVLHFAPTADETCLDVTAFRQHLGL